jgi:hypothetical protein
MAARLAFAKKYQHWIAHGWSNVIWTDESSFEMGKLWGQVKVWHKVYGHYNWKYLAPTFKLGRISVMFWGAFSGFHKRPLVLMPPKRRKTTHFIDDIYERVSSGLYFLHDDIDNVLLMEDGAPMHCTHISQQWRQAHGIRMLQ